MVFHVQDFLDSLPIMGMGMAGIFIVTLIIIAVVALLNLLTSDTEK